MREMLRVKDVADYVESVAPLIEGDDSGLIYGNMNSGVKGVVVCWSPTLEVLKTCQRLGCNLIISHEWLFYFKSDNRWMENEQPTFAKMPNLKRLEILTKNKINVLRYHRNWDAVDGGVADTLGEYLGFRNCIKKGFFARVYTIKPMKLADLLELVNEKLQTTCVCHGNPERRITCVGIACGGVGQTFTFAEEFLGTPTQAIIFGEMLEYTKIYTRELDYDFIVTSHEASETPGLIKLADLLRDNLFRNEIPTHFISSSGKERS